MRSHCHWSYSCSRLADQQSRSACCQTRCLRSTLTYVASNTRALVLALPRLLSGCISNQHTSVAPVAMTAIPPKHFTVPVNRPSGQPVRTVHGIDTCVASSKLDVSLTVRSRQCVEIKCQLDATEWFLLQNLLSAQHVSGTIMPIIGSSRVILMVAACGTWRFGLQVVGLVWSCSLCVRVAGCCSSATYSKQQPSVKLLSS
jgi:hypothetical protein